MNHDRIQKNACHISLKNVSLEYELYYDKTNSLKEFVVNALHRRRYVREKTSHHAALKNINLEISHGERLGIIGLNGSGKSTLLKVISGILKPTAGSLDVRGTIQPLIEIGAGFNPEFSGRENIFLNGYMLGFSRKQIMEREEEIIEFSELAEFIDIPVKYYSSGMAVRLAFTIATIISPEILVFDEMLSAGDAGFIEKAKRRMDKLLSSAKMLVIVSHDLDIIRSITRRTIVLKNGEIVFDGPSVDAIDFYADMVGQKTKAQEEALAEKERAAAAEAADAAAAEAAPPRPRSEQETLMGGADSGERSSILILPESGSILNSTTIEPGSDLEFAFTFQTMEHFDEFFFNVHVFDSLGAQLMHLRNDFSGVRFNQLRPGTYRASIPVRELPFRSGEYKFQLRLVGISSGTEIVKDAPLGRFTISSGRPYHAIFKHEWNLHEIDVAAAAKEQVGSGS